MSKKDYDKESVCPYSEDYGIRKQDLYLVSNPAIEMNVMVVGVNFRSAAISFREKLAFNYEQTLEALNQLKNKYPASGFVLLSTCNRVELYCSAACEDSLTCEKLAEELILLKQGDLELKEADSFYYFQNREAVNHLLEVSCSLDSLVLGESQIIAQVRDAYYAASKAGVTDKIINRLFHCAFTCSKEVYSTTSISQRRVSVASVAVYYAAKLLGSFDKLKAVIIGAGEMGELIIRHLKNAGCKNITVVNRTIRRSQLVAERLMVDYRPWDELKTAIADSGIIVAAANAGDVLFDRSHFPGHLNEKKVILDIAVPRNFANEVGELENVELYCVDDLSQAAHDNMQARAEDIQQAREIIEDDVNSFIEWFGVMDVGPMAGRLRSKFHQIADDELRKLYGNMKEMDETSRQQIEVSVKRLVNKYLHSLINGFNNHAHDVDPQSVVKMMEQIIEQEHRQI